nr:MAG TPA: hypothetical protein [Caudoviricetes sp.]
MKRYYLFHGLFPFFVIQFTNWEGGIRSPHPCQVKASLYLLY